VPVAGWSPAPQQRTAQPWQNASQSPGQRFMVVVVGISSVGKTSSIIAPVRRQCRIPRGHSILRVWDTASHERITPLNHTRSENRSGEKARINHTRHVSFVHDEVAMESFQE
jgi:hypothetical protein